MTTRFRDWFDWLGTLKSRNADISSDALRIGQLEAANKALKADLKTARDEAARAIVSKAIAEGKCERAQDQLAEAQAQIDNLLETSGKMSVRCEGLEDRLEEVLRSREYTTGVKRLAAIAKYRRSRA